MENKEKDVKEKFIEMIIESWAYARMTEDEQKRLLELLNHTMINRPLKYTYEHKWDILQAVYYSYLIAIEYQPTGWREEKEDEL